MRNAPRRYRRGQWLVERERQQTDLPGPPRPLDDAEPIQSGIDALMQKLGAASLTWLNTLQQDWADIVGKTVAAHTRPGQLQERVLTVYVDSSAWLAELSHFGRDEMLKNLQKKYGTERIKSVRLQNDPDAGNR